MPPCQLSHDLEPAIPGTVFDAGDVARPTYLLPRHEASHDQPDAKRHEYDPCDPARYLTRPWIESLVRRADAHKDRKSTSQRLRKAAEEQAASDGNAAHDEKAGSHHLRYRWIATT